MPLSYYRHHLFHAPRIIWTSSEALCCTRPGVGTSPCPGTQCFSTTHAPRARRRPYPPSNPRRRLRIRERTKDYKRLLSIQELITSLGKNNEYEKDTTSQPKAELRQNHSFHQTSAPAVSTDGEPRESNPSQLLSRSFLESRLAHKGTGKIRKRLPTKEEMNLLQYNPYAQALASPIRACYATGARLPSAFLNRWGLIQHPETKNFWLMPTSLLETELGQVCVDDHDDALYGEKEDGAEDNRRETLYRNPKRKKKVTPLFLRQTTRPMYLSNTMTIFRALAKIQPNAVARNLIPHVWKSPKGPITKIAERKTVWREDMDEFLLKRLRAVAVKQLKRAIVFLSHPADQPGFVTLELGRKGGTEALREALKQMELKKHSTTWGAILIVQPRGVKSSPHLVQETDSSSAASSSAPGDASQHDEFPDCISPAKTNVRFPIFDLTKLLTKEDLEQLAENVPYFREGALFLQPGKVLPMKMVLKLWALKSYMTH